MLVNDKRTVKNNKDNFLLAALHSKLTSPSPVKIIKLILDSSSEDPSRGVSGKWSDQPDMQSISLPQNESDKLNNCFLVD